jgi:hypothetical protein
MRPAFHHAAAAALLATGLVAGAWGQMQNPATSTASDAMPGTPAATSEQGGSRARTHGSQPADVMHHDMNDTRNGTTESSSGTSGSHHRMTRSHHANRPADNASFPSGLRRCADMVDRDERASCAGDLYDENGQPKR